MRRDTNFLESGSIPDGKTLVALSGGADSVALLHALRDKGCTVYAAHLNHMLRDEESDRDEGFCRELCDGLEVALTVGRVSVAQNRRVGEGIEAAARRIRYDFLVETANACGCEFIATAHNANDNAETLLMNLARGTGLNGLGGIAPSREFDGVTIVRPLLERTRDEIVEYLHRNGLTHVDDSTNADVAYSRNFVRHQIVPLMLTLNPRFVEHCTALSRSLRSSDPRCDVWRERFGELSDKTLERVHVESILRLAEGINPSATLSLPDGVVARRVYGDIVLERPQALTPPEPTGLQQDVTHFGGWTVTLTEVIAPQRVGSLAFVHRRFADGLTVRPRCSGDSISPVNRNWSKTLQRLLIDCKVPLAEREFYPVVCVGQEVAAVPGFAANRRFAAKEGEDAVLILFQKTSEVL